MKIVTEQHRRKFVFKWLLQSPCDFESFCRNYVAKHYELNKDIFLDLEDTLFDIANDLDLDHFEDFDSSIIKSRLQKNSKERSKFIGDILFIPIENSEDEGLVLWEKYIKGSKKSNENVEEFFLEFEFHPSIDFLDNSKTLKKQKESNFSRSAFPSFAKRNKELRTDLLWILGVILKQVEFNFLLNELLIKKVIFFPQEKIRLMNEYTDYLPQQYIFDTLLESYLKVVKRSKFFKKHLSSPDLKLETKEELPEELKEELKEAVNVVSKSPSKRGRNIAPNMMFDELLTDGKIETYNTGKDRFVEYCKPLKGYDMAYVCLALQKLDFLPAKVVKKSLHKALEQETGCSMDLSGFSKIFKPEHHKDYASEVAAKEIELKRIFSLK